MTTVTRLAALALGAALVAAPLTATAQSFDNHIAARKGEMQIMSFNLGILGGMARGNMPYDAEAAQAAADNLVAISQLTQTVQWAEGSDNMELSNTRALPAIWDDFADFQAKWASFGERAVALQAVAGQGAEGLGAAIGGVGGTCQACHEAYRQPN
jgi:cytochrome c556